MGTKLVGDHLSRGTKFFWTICPVQWDQIFGDHLTLVTKFDGDRLSRGINLMGIVSPGGQEVGDWKSGDQMGLGPNACSPLFKLLCSKWPIN